MKVLFIKKKSEDTISTDELINIFENEDDLEVIKEAVERGEERVFATWASVEMKDKAGELIPIEDIIKQQDTLIERNGPITDEHTNRVHGETVAYKVLEHPKTKTKGVLHLNKVFDHNDMDEQFWNEIIGNCAKEDRRTGSSVGGYNTSVSRVRDKVTGEKATQLDGFVQMETASVKDPCNPMATNEAYSVVAKSNKGMSDVTKRLLNKINRLLEDD